VPTKYKTRPLWPGFLFQRPLGRLCSNPSGIPEGLIHHVALRKGHH
jgi:hypothetical protein